MPIEKWPITNENVAGTNVLGLVFYSLLIGLAIGKIGETGKPLSDFFNSSADVMMKIMKWVTLYALLYIIPIKYQLFNIILFLKRSQCDPILILF